ncbi:MAG: hypothetical protein V4639_06710 [Pseudomonadota bacterium]
MSAITAAAVFQNIAVNHFAKGRANFTAERCAEESAQGRPRNRAEHGARWPRQSTNRHSQARTSECSGCTTGCAGKRANGAACSFGSVFGLDAWRLALRTLN